MRRVIPYAGYDETERHSVPAFMRKRGALGTAEIKAAVEYGWRKGWTLREIAERYNAPLSDVRAWVSLWLGRAA